MKFHGIKHIMVAAATAVITAIAGQAQAFTFTDGDLVLALYGNETEALYNLGKANTLLAPGAAPTSLDVSAGLTAAGVGTNPVRYAVYGHDALDPNNIQLWAGTNVDPAQINAGLLGITIQFGFSVGQAGLGGFTGDTVAKADPQSFSSNLDPTGDSNFSGTWPVPMFGAPSEDLNILKGDVLTSAFTQVGKVSLSSGGLFTIGLGGNPVPLPAGVVLFGTGLIGLLGIARRSLGRMAA